jgi:hypothetical protein
VNDDMEMSVSAPLDEDAFLRRECPTCEREFKWFPTQNGDPPSPGGYYCPYCGVQAQPDAWLTKAQVDMVQNKVMREVVGPAMQDFGRSFGRIAKSSGGLVRAELKGPEIPPEADPLTEQDDMRRIDFACHPEEPLKVLDNWSGPVYCLICGTPRG